MTATDMELLREYVVKRSEEAFASIVERHLSLVYSAALRQVRSPHLAEEVAQSVFADLARNAGRLKASTTLSAWLYEVARRTAIDIVRRESRRQSRERAAGEMTGMNSHPSMWSQIEPLLDEAMETLEAKDRAAILLRYFQNKSLREIGQSLGTSEDAAQKRVSRAVERLREFLSRQGVSVGAGGLVAAISANAAQAAPGGLLAAITASAKVGVAVTQSASVMTLAQSLAMTTTQKVLLTTLVTAAVGTGIYSTQRIIRLQHEVAVLRGQREPSAAEVEALRRERDAVTNRLATLQNENELLRQNAAELPRLRGELARFRAEALGSTQARDGGTDPFVQKAVTWKQKEAKLRLLMETRPEHSVPELRFLHENAWLDVAREANLDTEEGIRKALSELRRMAKNHFVSKLQEALRGYTEENNQFLPQNLRQLKPYFEPPVEDAFLNELLDQYSLLRTGKMADVPKGEWVIRTKPPVDKENDVQWEIGPHGYTTRSSKEDARMAVFNELMSAYAAANKGEQPTKPSDLLPYIKTAEQRKMLEEFIKSTSANFKGEGKGRGAQ